jgi:disulfide bond formation protein DsbB
MYRVDPDKTLIIVVVASFTALAAAYVAQYGFDLHPCVLCLYQRWPYGIAIVIAVLTLLAKGRGRSTALWLCGISLAAGAGIAGFHVGVEQGWWEGTASCTGSVGTASTIDDLRKQLMAAPVVRCDEPAFTLFGISMAGYNFLYAFALAVIAVAGAWRLHRQELRT